MKFNQYISLPAIAAVNSETETQIDKVLKVIWETMSKVAKFLIAQEHRAQCIDLSLKLNGWSCWMKNERFLKALSTDLQDC